MRINSIMFFVALCTLGLSGCSVINVYEGGTRIKRHFGLPLYSINTAAPGEALYIDSRGIGLLAGATGVSLGYINETYVAVPKERCVAVFIKPTKEAIQALTAAKVDLSQLCIYP